MANGSLWLWIFFHYSSIVFIQSIPLVSAIPVDVSHVGNKKTPTGEHFEYPTVSPEKQLVDGWNMNHDSRIRRESGEGHIGMGVWMEKRTEEVDMNGDENEIEVESENEDVRVGNNEGGDLKWDGDGDEERDVTVTQTVKITETVTQVAVVSMDATTAPAPAKRAHELEGNPQIPNPAPIPTLNPTPPRSPKTTTTLTLTQLLPTAISTGLAPTQTSAQTTYYHYYTARIMTLTLRGPSGASLPALPTAISLPNPFELPFPLPFPLLLPLPETTPSPAPPPTFLPIPNGPLPSPSELPPPSNDPQPPRPPRSQPRSPQKPDGNWLLDGLWWLTPDGNSEIDIYLDELEDWPFPWQALWAGWQGCKGWEVWDPVKKEWEDLEMDCAREGSWRGKGRGKMKRRGNRE